jgi:hypothetical protein
MTRADEYREYLKSAVWAEKRKVVIEAAGYRCQLCNVSRTLHVHHRTYPKELGSEPTTDLIALCERCHSTFHGVTAKKKATGRRTDPELERLKAEWRAGGITGNKIRKMARKYKAAKKKIKRRSAQAARGCGPVKIYTRAEIEEFEG